MEAVMYIRVALLMVASLGLMTNQAFAYIDPGTGSVVTAAIVGFFAAIAYTARQYFYRLKDMVTGRGSTANRIADSKEK